MRRAAVIAAFSMLSMAVSAQEVDTTIRVDSIVVTASRSLRDVGIQKITLDKNVLQETVSQSLAEVLSQNSTIFIKSSGRASLSTASLRGAAPSHTRVKWNGLDLSNPMLGMTDFSMIPSYMVDRSSIYYGASSVGVTGGGLGGAVELSNTADDTSGFGAAYVQSMASYNTFDEFLHLRYGNGRFHASTRLLCTSSDNDFVYTNYDKLGHPAERNSSCGWKDLHAMQELYYTSRNGSRLGFAGWWTDSSRGIPRLTVDYRTDDQTRSWQDEESFRGVVSWGRSFGGLRIDVRGGYTASDGRYTYRFSNGGTSLITAVDARNRTRSAFGHVDLQWNIGNSLLLQLSTDARNHRVDSHDEAALTANGYKAERNEMSFFGSVRWKPTVRTGIALNLREESYDGRFTQPIPALLIEYDLLPDGGLILSASAARNYRYPTLNDLYYSPGGNPDLRPETGYVLDGGLEFHFGNRRSEWGGKLTVFGSHTEDWILWRPTAKGYWTPMNLAAVGNRGIESNLHFDTSPVDGWKLKVNAHYGLTRSVNLTEGDAGKGRQLPYIPLHSVSLTASIVWRAWKFDYKWQYHSERQTSVAGGSLTAFTLPDYFMSDVSLSKSFIFNLFAVKVRFDCNNLFGEEYQSVLARPMPGRNYALSVEFDFGTGDKNTVR